MRKSSFGLKALAAGTAAMTVLAMAACGGDDKPRAVGRWRTQRRTVRLGLGQTA